jgi:hypothetical protein
LRNKHIDSLRCLPALLDMAKGKVQRADEHSNARCDRDFCECFDDREICVERQRTSPSNPRGNAAATLLRKI